MTGSGEQAGDSPFAALPSSLWVASNSLAFAVLDAHPVSKGHTLIVTRRIVPTWFEATAEERDAIFALIDAVKRRLDSELHPDGYNVGFNAGTAAGQTILHLHVRTLLSLGGREAPSVRTVLEADADAQVDLPGGCSVQLELEAKTLLSRMFRVSASDEVERAYRELRIERGQRPTAGELERMGYLPSRLRARHGSWFGFVHTEHDLDVPEAAAAREASAFLGELEAIDMPTCFPMIALEALLEKDALRSGLSLTDLARHSHAILRRSPELFAELPEDQRTEELDGNSEEGWLRYWNTSAIPEWTSAKRGRRAWFRVTGDQLVPAFSVSEAAAPALERLVTELTDYRLAQYRSRKRFGDVTSEGFVCRVISNQRDPILKLPADRGTLRIGELEVWVGSSIWQFRFQKEFCNVARPAGFQRNQLPDLLRRWIGPSAGQPGTNFTVRFRASPDGLWAEPVQSTVDIATPRLGVVAYPDLRAAAGHLAEAIDPSSIQREHVALPLDAANDDLFAVRICGTSMDGGRTPMRDGDWAVMKLARHAPAGAVEGRVVLVEVPSAAFGTQYQIKRLRRQDGKWLLTSDNPDGPSFDAREDTTVIARVEQTFSPEDLAPPPGTALPEHQLPAAFGLDELSPQSGRYGGHLFVFIDREGLLEEPDRVRQIGERRPGETAYVLARREDGTYSYLGVGRADDDDPRWAIPEVDHATWRKWGHGRDTSRRLPDGARARAQVVADALIGLPDETRWLERADHRRARVLGTAPRGGIRIDGGEGGFNERTVSLTDLAWVIVAADDVREHGGLLDEARVNRLRYLDGTPKGATRWIDTGWAIAAWDAGKHLARQVTASAGELQRIHRDDGSPVDASFRVEPAGDILTVVFESRGGTRGTARARNTEYDAGLQFLLERLGRANLRIVDAVVDSRETASLGLDERRLRLDGYEYPIAVSDADALRRAMSAAQTRIGRQPGARGRGNRTRRLRLYVEAEHLSVDGLGRMLSQR